MDDISLNSKDPLADTLLKRLKDWQESRQRRVEDIWRVALQNFRGVFDPRPEQATDGHDWRSDSFYPLTEVKVMAGVSHVIDTLFGGRGTAFPYDIQPTPIPDSPINEMMEQMGFSIEARVNGMRKLIDDQLVEGKAHNALQDAVFTSALYGTACIQSPMIRRVSRNRWEISNEMEMAGEDQQREAEFSQVRFREVSPSIKNIDIWDIFPDPESDGSGTSGAGIFHRQYMSLSELRGLMDMRWPDSPDGREGAPMYDAEAIQSIIDMRANDKAERDVNIYGQSHPDRDDLENPLGIIEVFTYSGVLTRADLGEHVAQFQGGDEIGDHEPIEMIVVMSEGRVLQAFENFYPGQRRPYHLIPWERIAGTPWGRGIAEKLFDVQDSINSLFHSYLDNKKISVNNMFAIDESKLEKDCTLDIYPAKNWRFKKGTVIRDAFQSITIPDVTSGALEGIARMLEWADQASGIPRILEGQPGVRSQTAFAENQRIQAATKQMALVLKNIDRFGIVPAIEALYDWNMEFADDSNIKGDFAIEATGFSSFENKTVKLAHIQEFIINAQQNPDLARRVNFGRLYEDWARLQGVDPDRYLVPEEELAEKAQAEQEQAEAMKEEALEQLAAETEIETQGKIAIEQAKAEAKLAAERITAQSKAEQERAKLDHQAEMKLIDVETKT